MLVAGMKNNSKYNNSYGLFQFCFYIILESK